MGKKIRMKSLQNVKLIEIECKVAGLSAKLKRTEDLAKVTQTTIWDNKAIEITQQLWENKRMLQLLVEENDQAEGPR